MDHTLQPPILTAIPDQAVGVYCIGEEALPWVDAQVAKHNKRAAKLGQGRLTLVLVNSAFWLLTDPGDAAEGRPPTYRAMQSVRIDGSIPRIAGWHLVAALQHEDEGTIIRRVPDVDPELDIHQQYGHAPAWCDHCASVRKRIDTWVLRHEDGTLKQVGSSCLTDFLGGSDPKAILEWALFLNTLTGTLRSGDDLDAACGEPRAEGHATLPFLSYVAACIRNEGWVSRTMVKDRQWGVATADAAILEMERREKRERGERIGRKPLLDVTAADEARAQGALAWARTQMVVGDEYTHNLHTALAADVLNTRSLGLAASVFVGYGRVEERRLQEAALPYAPGYLGPVGKTVLFTGLVTSVRELQGQWGVTFLYTFTDTLTGRRAKWFASRDLDVRQGQQVTLEGKVKGQEVYQEKDVTVLTRCKVLAVSAVAGTGATPVPA